MNIEYSKENIDKVEALFNSALNNVLNEDINESDHVYFIKTDEELDLLENCLAKELESTYAEFSSYFDLTIFKPVQGNELDKLFNKSIRLFVSEKTNTIYNRVR